MVDGVRIDLTQEEIDAKIAEDAAFQAEKTANEYKIKRKRDMKDSKDLLEKLYNDLDNGTLDKTGDFYLAMKKVMDDNPAP